MTQKKIIEFVWIILVASRAYGASCNFAFMRLSLMTLYCALRWGTHCKKIGRTSVRFFPMFHSKLERWKKICMKILKNILVRQRLFLLFVSDHAQSFFSDFSCTKMVHIKQKSFVLLPYEKIWSLSLWEFSYISSKIRKQLSKVAYTLYENHMTIVWKCSSDFLIVCMSL